MTLPDDLVLETEHGDVAFEHQVDAVVAADVFGDPVAGKLEEAGLFQMPPVKGFASGAQIFRTTIGFSRLGKATLAYNLHHFKHVHKKLFFLASQLHKKHSFEPVHKLKTLS